MDRALRMQVVRQEQQGKSTVVGKVCSLFWELSLFQSKHVFPCPYLTLLLGHVSLIERYALLEFFFFFFKFLFPKHLENEMSLLVVEAVGWHSLGTSGVSFLDMWGMPFTWKEWRWQAEKQRQGWRGRGTSIHFLTSRSSQGPKVAVASLACIPCILPIKLSFALAILRWVCVFQNPETFFKYRGYCSGLGKDSGEPASGQGEKMEGGTWVEKPLWSSTCLDWTVRMWRWCPLRDRQKEWTTSDFKRSLAWL